MSRTHSLGFSLLLLAAHRVGCGAPSGPVVTIVDAWARPAMALAGMSSDESSEGGMGHAKGGTGAVYMVLVNKGGEPDRLVGGATDIAEVLEIHETVIDGDVMKMRMLPDGLQVPARGEVVLKPGSYHIMLIGVKHDLVSGDRFTLELEFEKSGSLTVELEVREP